MPPHREAVIVVCNTMSRFLTIFLLAIPISSGFGQSTDKRQINKVERYFSEREFNDNFGKEMVSASEVYEQRKNIGMKDYAIAIYDFVFISDVKNKLDSLGHFLLTNYGYKLTEIKKANEHWELTGTTTRFPVDKDNLMYWALDLYCKGFEFDCKLDGYGAVADSKNQEFPKMDTSLADSYFDLGIEAYKKRNLGMAIIYFTTVLNINPKDAQAYYSRAIAKDELHTWKAARRDYDQAIDIEPNFVHAIVNRAANKDEAGEYDEAIKDYDKAIMLEPRNAMAYFNRGNTKLNKGDKKGACIDWEKAKELGADYARQRIDEICK